MKTIVFVTTNPHKFKEVSAILSDYPLKLEHVNQDYEENHDASLEEVARDGAKLMSERLNRPVVVEDTGVFFDAYEGFPGALPKFVFNSLGYRGILKLLEGEKRDAEFMTVVAYCEPGSESVTFTGTLRGVITEKVYDEGKDTMPYNRIFIAEGKDAPTSQLSLEEWNAISQRGQAFRKFGDYIKQRSSPDTQS